VAVVVEAAAEAEAMPQRVAEPRHRHSRLPKRAAVGPASPGPRTPKAEVEVAAEVEAADSI